MAVYCAESGLSSDGLLARCGPALGAPHQAVVLPTSPPRHGGGDAHRLANEHAAGLQRIAAPW